MSRIRLVCLSAVLLATTTGTPSARGGDDGAARAAARAAAVRAGERATALVVVHDSTGRRTVAFGSSFCIDAYAGLFVTNEHVVSAGGGAAKLTVVVDAGQPNQRELTATVVKADKGVDLAVLKVPAHDLTGLELGDPVSLVETSAVVAYGFPFGDLLTFHAGQFPTVSVNAGRVTALRRDHGELQLIQMDAAVNPGNSGGPLLDETGRVVGVVDAGIKGTGVNFAVPTGKLVTFLHKAGITLTPAVLPPNRPGDADPAPEPPPESDRSDVPTAVALAAADRSVTDVYGKQIDAARTAAARVALADQLATLAEGTRDDPPGRFALLTRSADLSVAAGDVRSAMRTVGRLTAGYKVDAAGLEAATVAKLSPTVPTAEARGLLAAYALRSTQRLLDADRYAEADATVAVARTAANGSSSSALRALAAEWGAYVSTVDVEWAKVQPAVATLKAHPSDAAANTALGQFYCGIRGDWRRGLPQLAAGPGEGPDAAWRSLALADLQTPVAAAEQVKLGDGWWDLAQRQPAQAKLRLSDRAGLWYRRARPALDGLARAVVDKRLATLPDGIAGPAAVAAAVTVTSPAAPVPLPTTGPAPDAVDPSGVTVVAAYYVGNGRTADVHDAVARLIAAGKPFIVTYNVIGADPAPGKPKTLSLTYERNGRRKTVKYRGGDLLDPAAL